MTSLPVQLARPTGPRHARIAKVQDDVTINRSAFFFLAGRLAASFHAGLSGRGPWRPRNQSDFQKCSINQSIYVIARASEVPISARFLLVSPTRMMSPAKDTHLHMIEMLNLDSTSCCSKSGPAQTERQKLGVMTWLAWSRIADHSWEAH